MQTMADAAVLSDGEVQTHFERTEELTAQGAVGISAGPQGGPIDLNDSAAALQLLRRVLRRELKLRDMPVGVPVKPGEPGRRPINGTVRGRAWTIAVR
jgi:hypothetical protein